MKSVALILLSTAVCFLLSCDTHRDPLQIINSSSETVYYGTAFYDASENKYISAPASDEVPVGKTKSPAVRGSLKYMLLEKPYDHFLYFYFFADDLREHIWNRADSFVRHADPVKIKVLKFSRHQLDSMNWKIVYKG